MLELTADITCDGCGKKNQIKGALADFRKTIPPEVWNGDAVLEAYCPECRAERWVEEELRKAFGMGPNDTKGQCGEWTAEIVDPRNMPEETIEE